MNTGATLVLNLGATQTFELPQGWTLRKVAASLAREWLAPFRPQVVVKSARWAVQPIVEKPANGQPLWEVGISTAEYEHRLERPDLNWSVQARLQARAGQPRGMVLARLIMNPSRPMTFDMACSQDELPATLIDPDKLAAFLEAHGIAGAEGLFASLLIQNGFHVAR